MIHLMPHSDGDGAVMARRAYIYISGPTSNSPTDALATISDITPHLVG
jgi:hypothetical protein